MKTETITWHELPDDGLPDAEITVVMEIEQADGSTETWPGWWCGERWIDASSGTAVQVLGGVVVAWADVPDGSRAGAVFDGHTHDEVPSP